MPITSTETDHLRAAILAQLCLVIDPETGADVVRMRLIEELTVDESGQASYTFRPSSELCPIALPLALMIRTAVSMAAGVVGQTITVKGHTQAETLTEWLNSP